MTDIRQLTYFIGVVEAGSFTAAANVLHVAQTALSQHIQNLEHEFKQQLLVRHSRGVQPTAAGLRLVEHAHKILTALRQAKDDLQQFTDDAPGEIMLGLPRSLCDLLGTAILTEWLESHPAVELRITQKSSDALAELVAAGEVDLAVTSFPLDSKALHAEPLLQDKMFAVMSPDVTGLGDTIRFADLVERLLILHHSTTVSRQLIDVTAKYCSAELRIACEIDSPDLAIDLVKAKVGAAIQPYVAVRKYFDSSELKLCRIVEPGITRRMHIIRLRHRPLSQHEVALTQVLKSHLAKILGQTDKRAVHLDFLVD